MPDRFHPYDPDLADIGYIEPVFVQELVGYVERKVVIDEQITAGLVTEVTAFGDAVPRYLACHYEAIPPTPVYRTALKWRLAD